jgi:O-antigen/teichoic acid export membrane protein
MRETVLRGVAWVGGVMFLVRAVRYVALLVLGGLLTPEEFGLFAALFVIIDGLALLQGFGIGQALIYRQNETDASADTSLILSLLIGAVLVTVAWFVAPLAARFYREPSMTALFRAASFVLVLHGLRLVPFRLLEKALDFRRKLVPGLSGSLAYFAVAITLALRGAGAWSLVWAEISSVLSETVAYWITSSWRPKWKFSRKIALEDLSFGWLVVGGSALIFAFRNVDRIMASRLLGTHALGLYAFAYSLANLPATLFVRVLNTVLFPSYAALGEDRAQQRDLFLRSTSYMAAAGLTYAVGLLVFGRYFLFSMYGDKWLAATVSLYALAAFALFRALFALVGDLLVATGHPTTFRKLSGLQLLVAGGGLYFGATYGGIAGVAVVMALAQLSSMAVGWAAATRILSIEPSGLVRAVRGPITAAVLSLGLGLVLLRSLPDRGSVATLAAAVAAFCAGYAAFWWLADGVFRSELRDLLTGGRGPLKPGAGGEDH